MGEFICAGVRVDDFNVSRACIRDSCGFHFDHRVREFQWRKDAHCSTVKFELAADASLTSEIKLIFLQEREKNGFDPVRIGILLK